LIDKINLTDLSQIASDWYWPFIGHFSTVLLVMCWSASRRFV